MGDVDKEVAELTGVAERNGQRLLDLINDILDIEKIESGKLTLVPELLTLDELVGESLVLNKGFAERFQVRYEPRGTLLPVQVKADRKRLLQVMTNLLSNAAKFSPAGEAVQVSMEDLGTRVRIGVHDHGPGIPENFRGRIFGRFAQADSSATRQKGGTGLGLAICKRLIELMDGQHRVHGPRRRRHGVLFRAAQARRGIESRRHPQGTTCPRNRSTASATSRTTRTSRRSCAWPSSASAR